MATKENFLIEQFKKYKVFLYTGGVAGLSTSVIHLTLPSGKAILRFKDGRLKKNKSTKKGKKMLFEIYIKSEHYPNFIDILRNEKPLYFFYDYNENLSYITTSDEPVGEGEK